MCGCDEGSSREGPHYSPSSDVCLPCWEGFEINIMRTKHDRRHDFQHVFNICNVVNIHYLT